MAEVEFGDLKVSGGKLLLVIPFLGSIGAALWGGFELYQRLLTAEEAIEYGIIDNVFNKRTINSVFW